MSILKITCHLSFKVEEFDTYAHCHEYSISDNDKEITIEHWVDNTYYENDKEVADSLSELAYYLKYTFDDVDADTINTILKSIEKFNEITL